MSAIASASLPLGAPFRVGEALNRAYKVFVAGFGKFVVLTAVPLAPVLVIELIATGLPPNAQAGLKGLASIVQFVLGALATGTCLFGAYQIMRDRPFSISKSFSAASGRIASVLVTSLLVGLLAGLATLALIVPGVMLMCMWYVALPAVIVERLKARASMRRSRALTSGYRWPIFGLLLLAGILAAVALGVAGALFALVVALTGHGGSLATVAVVLTFLGTVVGQAFGAVLSAVVYHDLRVAKEGVDIERLTNVFD